MTTESKPFCGMCGAPRVDTVHKFCPDCGAPYATSAPIAVVDTSVEEPIETAVTSSKEPTKASGKPTKASSKKTPVKPSVTPSEEPKFDVFELEVDEDISLIPVRYNKEPSVPSKPAAAESKAPAEGEKPVYYFYHDVLFKFEGKATRSEYIAAFVIAWFVGGSILLLSAALPGWFGLMFLVGYIAPHYIFASATAARMRDAGQNSNWAWLTAVPFAVTILFIVGLVLPSSVPTVQPTPVKSSVTPTKTPARKKDSGPF